MVFILNLFNTVVHSRYYNTEDKSSGHDFIPPAYFVIMASLITWAIIWPCCIVAPYQLICSSSRFTKMKRAWKARQKKADKKKSGGKEKKARSSCCCCRHFCCCCPTKKVRNPIIETVDKPLVEPSEYPGGEADVLAANRHNAFCYEDLVSIVHCTGDTIFAFDPSVIYSLFDFIDNDGNGSLSPLELRTAARDVSVYVTT